MAKGLDLLLNRINAEPAPTLISRFLTLVQDLPDDREKAEYVLRLANSLAKGAPDEALRLAHEVYRLDPHRLQALDVMAEAFRAKGRFAKAAVVQLEKERLERRRGAQEGTSGRGESLRNKTPPASQRTQKSQSPLSPEAKGAEDAEGARLARMAGLEGLFALDKDEVPSQQAPANTMSIALLQEAIGAHPAQNPVSPGMTRLKGTPPGEVVISSSQRTGEGDLLHQEEMAEGITKENQQSPPQQRHEKTPPGGLSRKLLHRLMGREPGDTVLPFRSGALTMPADAASNQDMKSGPAARSSIAPGQKNDREELLPSSQSAADDESSGKDFPYRGAFEDFHILPGGLQGIDPVRGNVPHGAPRLMPLQDGSAARSPLQPGESGKAPPMWQALGPQLARLHQTLPRRFSSPEHTARLRALFATHPQAGRFPEPFIQALAELDHRLKGSDAVEILALKWDLFQGLWGAAPTGACADLLKALGLRHATPAFWGLYLDSLLTDRRFRMALQDMRQTLKKHPHLNWARIISMRLPMVWEGLQVHGFQWSEDDGVAVLQKALAERPKPKLAAILGISFTPKKAGS